MCMCVHRGDRQTLKKGQREGGDEDKRGMRAET